METLPRTNHCVNQYYCKRTRRPTGLLSVVVGLLAQVVYNHCNISLDSNSTKCESSADNRLRAAWVRLVPTTKIICVSRLFLHVNLIFSAKSLFWSPWETLLLTFLASFFQFRSFFTQIAEFFPIVPPVGGTLVVFRNLLFVFRFPKSSLFLFRSILMWSRMSPGSQNHLLRDLVLGLTGPLLFLSHTLIPLLWSSSTHCHLPVLGDTPLSGGTGRLTFLSIVLLATIGLLVD